MKISVERHRLNSTLRRMSAAVGASAPILISASQERLEMVAVGKEAVIYTGVDAVVETEGSADVMLRQIMSVLRSLPNGSVSLESVKQGLAISGGGTRVVMADFPDWCDPKLPEPNGQGQEIDGELLRSSLGGVIPAAATDNHPIFGSVRFDESEGLLRLVASDTFRLAVRDLPGTLSPGVFSVGVRALKRMLRALGKPPTYRVWDAGDYVWFSVEKTGQMGIACDRSDYPRYRGWSPLWEGRIVCARAPLLDLANRVVALDRKSPAPAKLSFSEAGIDFGAKSPVGMVSGSLQADHAELSAEVTLRFNSLYLADALSNMATDRAEFRLAEDPLARPKPVRIADANRSEVWNLLMPMRTG